MSVRPQLAPVSPSLTGNEGELVSVRISEEPRLLEKLLDALASVSFPVNPQIYHQAAIGYVYPSGREEISAATIVEFPAFSNQLREVRQALTARGLRGAVHVRNMLEDLHTDQDGEAAPDGVPYCRLNYYKHFPNGKRVAE